MPQPIAQQASIPRPKEERELEREEVKEEPLARDDEEVKDGEIASKNKYYEMYKMAPTDVSLAEWDNMLVKEKTEVHLKIIEKREQRFH